MDRNNFLGLVMILNITTGYGQDSVYISRNAIRIEKPDSLGNDIYQAISSFQLILVGEMHGSNESPRFVYSLADLLVKNGNNVQVGLEIPSEQMKTYLSSLSDSSIYHSDFFSNKRFDARASYAWADMIMKLNAEPHLEIFFYDIGVQELKQINDRDSLMYLRIKNKIRLHPGWKTITLSGNIHNQLIPYEGKTKMGLYLLNDKDLQLKAHLLSINQACATGSIWDNTGDSLQLYQVDHRGSLLTKSVDYENYLLLYPPGMNVKYNGVYFTRKLTPSKMVSE
jgi:hypothetical protein